MKKGSGFRFIAKHQDALQLGTALLFLVLVGVCAYLMGGVAVGFSPAATWLLVVAAAIGVYMAMNIGANDVANNMGPAVGSGAMTMGAALAVAALFEALGAIVAGGAVVNTIKSGVVDASQFADADTYVQVMLAALLAAALWLNLATALGAPVSTTHSIVGAIMGAGIAAGGWGLINWPNVGSIALSWVVSPLMGGALAAVFLYGIKRSVTYRSDRTDAARRVVPLLVALMVWAYTTYMLLKGMGRLVTIDVQEALLAGAALALVVWWFIRQPIARMAQRQRKGKDDVNRLFRWPLICSAALLSFAHGANDVANAVGPLAGIYEALKDGAIASQTVSPLWILALGALGLSVGLVLYGAGLIRTVGREITELDNMRAYAIAMAVAITVIAASQFGIPVSTTHIAIGAVFGVGFLRELLKVNYARMEETVFAGHQGEDHAAVRAYLARFEAAEVGEKKRMLEDMKRRSRQRAAAHTESAVLDKAEQKALKKVYKKEIVKRSTFVRILVAWIVTLPVCALLAAGFFYVVRAVLS